MENSKAITSNESEEIMDDNSNIQQQELVIPDEQQIQDSNQEKDENEDEGNNYDDHDNDTSENVTVTKNHEEQNENTKQLEVFGIDERNVTSNENDDPEEMKGETHDMDNADNDDDNKDNSDAPAAEDEDEEEEEGGDVEGEIGVKEEEEVKEETNREEKNDDINVKLSISSFTRSTKTPNFNFASEKKQVPSDMKKLHERTIQRRRNLLARMNNLDCQLAKITSLYAEEKMDLDLALHDTFERSVCQPLETASERHLIERDSSKVRPHAMKELERRISKLDQNMTKHNYVTMADAKSEQLDELHDQLFQDIIPGLYVDKSKSDKIVRSVTSRFENAAGTMTQQYHEECAAYRAEEVRIDGMRHRAVRERQLDMTLSIIAELRRKVAEEKKRRQEADKKIMEQIVCATISMKRALLEAVGGAN